MPGKFGSKNISDIWVGNKEVSKAWFGRDVIYSKSSEIDFPREWAQIAKVSEAGKAQKYFSIGDEKDITLTTGETLTLQIYGFDHDDLASGSGKAGITFGLKNLMAETRSMNSTSTNVGSFTGSDMYAWMTRTLLPSLSGDLQAAIKPVTKKTSAGSQSTTILSETMSIFLFSEVECFGKTTYSIPGEGSQYPIFTDNASRIKYLANGTGSANWWWERSPYAVAFCSVGTNGGPTYDGSAVTRGVCFGFCI